MTTMLDAAVEVTTTVSDPPIADAFYAATVSVPRNAWLSALAVVCQYRAEHPADDETNVTVDWAVRVEAPPGTWGWCGGRQYVSYPVLNRFVSLYTRGEVRRFCAAVGKPLTEATS